MRDFMIGFAFGYCVVHALAVGLRWWRRMRGPDLGRVETFERFRAD